MKPRSLVALIVGLVLIYPMSIGPVMACQRHLSGTPPKPPAFYQPLIELSKVSPAFRDTLRWYLECWGLPVSTPARKSVSRA